MQLQRWELKYVIPEDVALALREFVSSYLEIDEYGANKPNLSYSIHNLYLDSDDLQIYWGTINGNKHRFKLRLRFYADNPNPQAPVFFVIKRRMNEAILKQRCGMRRPACGGGAGGAIARPRRDGVRRGATSGGGAELCPADDGGPSGPDGACSL